MAKAIKMEHASMLNGQELLVELSDGRTVELNAEQILSLHPHSIGKERGHGEPLSSRVRHESSS